MYLEVDPATTWITNLGPGSQGIKSVELELEVKRLISTRYLDGNLGQLSANPTERSRLRLLHPTNRPKHFINLPGTGGALALI